MANGIIYVMTTVVDGLLKIGKTGTSNFESRMQNLESNGYRNITGLKRKFAIEVEDYDEKESLLHTIFEKSQVAETELFAVDIDIVVQLLSSFEGRVIYPVAETKEDIFDEAVLAHAGKLIPDGEYILERIDKSSGKAHKVKATAKVTNGRWILKKGSALSMRENKSASKRVFEARNAMILKDGVLMQDFDLGESSPSFASDVVSNGSTDGWRKWKNADGEFINIYRTHKEAADAD